MPKQGDINCRAKRQFKYLDRNIDLYVDAIFSYDANRRIKDRGKAVTMIDPAGYQAREIIRDELRSMYSEMYSASTPYAWRQIENAAARARPQKTRNRNTRAYDVPPNKVKRTTTDLSQN